MLIIKYVAVHLHPQKMIDYILNEDKTDDLTLAEGINCTIGEDTANEFQNIYEYYSGERFIKNTENETGKEKIRIHHYIQSFKPNEVTPEEAHNIGVEWAKKIFGENRQVIISTHIDKGHIHNHFAVAVYDLNGKAWHGNKESLRKCRRISDKIAKEHGFSVIENSKSTGKKYSEWLASQSGDSWKEKIIKDIDSLIQNGNVKSTDNLISELRKKGYTIKMGKYLSLKPQGAKYFVRSYKLGDAYSFEALKYRIDFKNHIKSELDNTENYKGIQYDYVLYLRHMHISLFNNFKHENVSFYSLKKNSDLLSFLCKNNITSIEEFENSLNTSNDNLKSEKEKIKEIEREISKYEKVISDSVEYLRIYNSENPTIDDRLKMQKLRYLNEYDIETESDVYKFYEKINSLKSELAICQENIETLKKVKSAFSSAYKQYITSVHSTDYDRVLNEQKRLLEEEKKQHKQKEENPKDGRERF